MTHLRRWLILYILIEILCSMWQLYWAMGFFVNAKLIGMVRIFFFIFFLLIVRKAEKTLPPVQRFAGFSKHVPLMLVLVAFLAVYGVLRGNPLNQIFIDAWVYVAFAAFLFLGGHDEVWRMLEKPLIVIFWICFVVVIFGLFLPSFEVKGGVLAESAVGASRHANTAAYRIRTILETWPLIFVLSYLRPRMDIWKIAGMTVIIAQLFLSVYFQFRAQSLYVLAVLFVAVTVPPLFQGKVRIGTTIVMLLIAAIFYVYISASSSFEQLADRFETESSGGRYVEAQAMLNSTKPHEYLIGRGMGGWYVPPFDWHAGVREHGNLNVRFEIHAGTAMAFLKGGIVLWVMYYLFFFRALIPRSRTWYTNRYNMSAILVVPLYWMTTLGVPEASFGTPMRILMIGLLCARLTTIATPWNHSSHSI